MENKEIFRSAKIGDRVWSSQYGWGTIVNISSKVIYPICAEFESKIRNYTFDGKLWIDDINPSLFWNKFEIPKKAYQKPLPDVPIDTLVLVWLDSSREKERGHFAGWDKDNNMLVWKYRCTSWTAEDPFQYSSWNNWEII